MYNKKIRQKAYNLYNEGLTISEIANKLKISYATVYNWSKQDSWNRNVKTNSPVNINWRPRQTHRELYDQILLIRKVYVNLVFIEKMPKDHMRDYIGKRLGITGRKVSNIIKEFEKTEKAKDNKKVTEFMNTISGFVYIITKKSTGELYIGETHCKPTKRWDDHLGSKNFPIDYIEIEDYKFEILEVVSKSDNIRNREKYYIKEYRRRYPGKVLNIDPKETTNKD